MKSRQNSPIANCRSEPNRRKTAHDLGRSTLAIITLLLVSHCAAAQDQTPQEQVVPQSAVITKSATAIGYEVGGGSTKVDLKGTELVPDGGGQAKVEIKSNAGRSS